jgi:hypothetical protein
MPRSDSLEDRVAQMESELTALRAEASVYRGALIWLMGVHQLGEEDQTPRRAILEPLGLALDYSSADIERQVNPELSMASRSFIEAAYRVFLSRQATAS